MALFHKLPGRPKYFENPDELRDLFYVYIEDCIENSKFPNIAGFKAYQGISSQRLFEYEKKEEYSDVFSWIKNVLEDQTLQDNNLHPTVKKLYMQSRLGYVEKTETKNTIVDNNIDKLSPEQRDERIKQLINKSKDSQD